MAKKSNYIPDTGDIIWLSFGPTKGSEQAGRRPALVLTPAVYNSKTGLCIACPITSKAKGYPFEIPCKIPSAASASSRKRFKCIVEGVVLVDQIRNLSWKERGAEKIGVFSDADILKVRNKIKYLLL